MKKTLTVNLNNIVFHIDDDAYDMLQTYLSEIANHFQSEDERREIMTDIEARIAELFTEKLQKNKNVVNVADVKEIIDIMGKPSQYADEGDDGEIPNSDKKQQKSRRFYRDPENAVLGGIASGLAAYFSWDVTLIRILMVLLVFLGVGFIIPVYVVVWFVAPQALTASQRLEMQGEDVTVDSIKAEMNNVKNYMESDKFKKSATSIGERILDIFKGFFKVVFGLVGLVLGVVGVVLLGALILLLFFLVFEPNVLSGFVPEIVSNWPVITSPDKMVMLIISLILVVGCPIFLIIYWAIRIVSGRRHNSHTASWVVLVLWVAGMFMFYSVGAGTFFYFQNRNMQLSSIEWNDNDLPMVDEVRKCEPFHSIDISGNIKLTLDQDSIQRVVVSSLDEYLPKIITNVKDGVLEIYSTEVFLNRTIRVNISSNSVERIEARGACWVETASQLVAPSFFVELDGASRANFDLKIAGRMNADLKGASRMKLAGSCNTFEVEVVGVSKTFAENFIAKNVKVVARGASRVEVFATESIIAKATDVSKIECKGDPENIDKFSGIGSRIRIE